MGAADRGQRGGWLSNRLVKQVDRMPFGAIIGVAWM
jgi:hypothetical protein